MAAVQNTSFTSPLSGAIKYVQGADTSFLDGAVAAVMGASIWTILLTILLGLVAYDQCKSAPCESRLDAFN
jgi:hypothetical protein